VTLLSLGMLLALPAPAAHAAVDDDADTEVARRHFQRGVQRYDVSDYEGALKEFRAANRVKPRPAFEFNIARCLDRMERYAEAVAAYQRFVAAAPDDPSVKEARERIALLQARLRPEEPDERPAATVGTTDGKAAGSTPGASPADVNPAVHPAVAGAGTPPPPPPRDTRARRTAVIAIAVGGGALVVGGVALGLGLGLSRGAAPATELGDTTVQFR
jgi:hypothetical protein